MMLRSFGIMIGSSALLLACGSALEPTQADFVQAASGVSREALENGTVYTLSPKALSGGGQTLCLDVKDHNKENGAALQLWQCTGADNQAFTRKGNALVVFGNKCLDVVNGQTHNGARVQLWDCVEGSANQAWESHGNLLQFKGSNVCLEVVNGLVTNNGALQVWACDKFRSSELFFMNAQSGSSHRSENDKALNIDDSGRKLLWNDEFDGDKIDTDKWNYEVNCDGGGNNEDQCYTSDAKNSWVKDGKLHIRIVKENYQNKSYTSARLNSAGKGDFTYGRFEARAKVPCGQGFWPAIWMMPTHSQYGSWPTSGELDIMEILGGSADTHHGTAHFGPQWPNNKNKGGSYSMTAGDFCQDFHEFAIERYKNRVVWSVDGQDFFTLNDNDADWSPAPHWPFDQPFFFILNVAMGGNWPGKPDASIQDGEMVIDYVRAYAPKD